MPKTLRRTQFGNQVLRQATRLLAKEEITSREIQQLIKDMYFTLDKKLGGVGLAAPQVGHSVAVSVINIHATKLRPHLPKEKWLKVVLINPKIIKSYGQRKQLYEGCLSFADVFAKVPRYKKIRISYLDEKGSKHEKDFEGLPAHVVQHEIDHLNGALFVDRVKDSSTYITGSEYRKMVRQKLKKGQEDEKK
jgi:peptide deformylase